MTPRLKKGGCAARLLIRLWCLSLFCAASVWAQTPGNQPVNTNPVNPNNQPKATFYQDLKNFLNQEDAARHNEQGGGRFGMVTSGGAHGTSVTMVSPSFATVAYTDEAQRINQATAAIDYTVVGCTSTDRAWVIISARAEDTLANFVRVAGTAYFVDCTSTNRPLLPLNAAWLMRVALTAGAITEGKPLFATNLTNPGRIYATDPYIGMVCDGHTDESAALQRAIQLSMDRGGAAVELPEGTCVVKNVVIEHQTEGGVDNDDKRRACSSLIGQGVGKTVLTLPDDATAEEFILKTSCTPLGAGHFSATPFNYPAGALIRDITFYGRITRNLEGHGLIAEGSHVRLESLSFHSINGHALWIGKDEKMESAWITNVHIRHSGRDTDDNLTLSGAVGSTNNAAMKFDSPSVQPNRNNNINVYGLQVVFNVHSSIHFECVDTFNADINFNGGMFHNHEAPGGVIPGSKQGRLDAAAGLVNIDGNCTNISFNDINLVSPGSDAFNTDDVTGPPVAGFMLQDTGGGAGPDAIFFNNIYFNNSCCGYGIRLKKARTVFINNTRGQTDALLGYPDGQLFVDPGSVVQLHACNTFFHPPFTFVPQSVWSAIRDCGRQVYVHNVTSDAVRAVGDSGGAWVIGAAASPAEQVRAHGLACTPLARHINVVHTDEPDACTELFVDAIDATNFTINCNAVVGGDGAAGEWSIRVPSGCGSALLTLPQTPLLTTEHQQVFIHGIFWTSDNPGTVANATNFATLTVSKRKILSNDDFATLSTSGTTLAAWTDVPFVITNVAELVWNAADALTLRIDKSGAGVALNQGTLTVIIGTNIKADQ